MGRIRSESRAGLCFLFALILGAYAARWEFPPAFVLVGLMVRLGVRATIDAANETHGRA